MQIDLHTHTLLRVSGPEALLDEVVRMPEWVGESLRVSPWVVVRRESVRDGMIPVGVRGSSRDQRFSSWMSADEILEQISPEALVACRSWLDAPRRHTIPALSALDPVANIMDDHGFAECWGPGGSVGFELASNQPVATAQSDLDVVLRPVGRVSRVAAESVLGSLQGLPVKADILLEMPRGAIVLAEYAQEKSTYVLRTRTGPCLIADLSQAW
jgi:phosphoribosyl-dephospho-CoA transferase